jgi:hypothetical protein
VNIHFVIVLPGLHAVERPADDKVDHVGYVDQHQQDYLNHWVLECHRDEYRSEELVRVVYERLGDIQRAGFGFYGVGEDQELVYGWLPDVGKVNFIAFVSEAVVFILQDNCLLKQDEVICLLEHQVHNRVSFNNLP